MTVDPDATATPDTGLLPGPSTSVAPSRTPIVRPPERPSPTDESTTEPSLDAAASGAPSATPFARSTSPTLGFISLDGSLPFVQGVATGVREAAAEAGIDLIACDPAWSAVGVLDCAAQMADAGVHALISFQPFPELADEVCAAIESAPTVGVVFEQGPCEVSRLEIDQAASGRLAGAAVGAFAADRWDCQVSNWVSLESSDSDPDGRARMAGYRDGYTEHCPLPERQFTLDDSDRLVTAQAQVAGLLGRLRGRPNLVVGINESAILGAMAAVRDAGRANQFWFSGQLADAAIRRDIACNDHYIASVAQFPERFGGPLVAAAMAAISGQPVAPTIDAELELVTADNVRALFPDTPECDG